MACDCPDEVTLMPGPIGPVGPAGANGTNGVDAFTTIVAPVVAIPAFGDTATIKVANTAWMVSSQIIYIGIAGYYRVSAVVDSTHVTVLNLGYTGNLGGGMFTAGMIVSPGGLQGPSGALSGAAGGDLTGTYPNPKLGILTTKGDTVATTGGGVGNAVRLPAGADGTRLKFDSGQPTGLLAAKVNLADTTEVTGVTGVANGGTGLAAGTSGGIPVFTGPTTIASSALLANFTPIVGGGAGVVARTIAGPGTAGQVLTSNGAAADPSFQASPTSGCVKELVYVNDSGSQALGVAGNNAGNFTSGSWQTRFISTIVSNTIGAGVSVAANQLTLPAGTYRFHCRAPGYKCDAHKLRFYDITNALVIQEGTNATAIAANSVQTDAFVQGRFNIAGSTVFELQHRCATTRNADGYGQATSLGSAETYAEIWIEREIP